MCTYFNFLTLLLIVAFYNSRSVSANEDFLVLTIATEPNDGYERFMRSARIYNIPVKVLGLGLAWKGGDIQSFPGGGQKVRILREAMEEFKDKEKMVIMFVDSYDVIFLKSMDEARQKFIESGQNIIFSAEGFCWPDKSLQNKYPEVGENEKRFLNSGGFMGYAPYIHRMVTLKEIEDTGDDQLYYTDIFLQHRESWKIQLDTKSEIFQNLNGALGEVSIKYDETTGYLYNTLTGSNPLVAHGNGPIKSQFNSLTNYLAKTWTPTEGCLHCTEDTIDLSAVEKDSYPRILMAIFIEQPTPFAEEFLNRLGELTYPKKRIDVSIHYSTDMHKKEVTQFKTKFAKDYNSFAVFNPKDFEYENDTRNAAIKLCQSKSCDFLFAVDSIAQLWNPKTLDLLVSQNRSILAPMLTRVGKLWSNFWGAVSRDGYYARSDDYLDIVQNTKLGVWNVPFVSVAYLIQRRVLPKLENAYNSQIDMDPDVAFAASVRNLNIFMFVTNMMNFGHQVDADNFRTDKLHNDLWEINNNPVDWRGRYVHPNYSLIYGEEVGMQDIEQPCRDVFWFPITSPRFCSDLIEEVENFGQWSDGSNRDSRLEGGYENVPTRDIHMRQITWEEEWMTFLKTYVYPMQRKLFQGYDDVPTARMNFVVRYRPDEQAFLRAHHDSSSYTLNMALNTRGKDYEGGGAHFIRYDCKVVDTRVGWVLMHPGRVTHIHEGLTTTAGTRYVFVTFVNP